MSARYYEKLDEQLFKRELPNGLTVLTVPKPGFTKKLAYFVTDFGSIHTDFELDGEVYQVPAGVAHYLEHKLFDMPGGRDISAEFAAFGAGVNAFTSFDMTAYYFSCTEHFEDCLRLLLEFVSTPYFTQETVQKEQGIIGQEIGMNADSADTRVFEDLMRAMYREHPVRVPILGTVDSIAQITPEILHTCHRAFYTPGNMVLCVVGDADAGAVEDIAAEVLGSQRRSVGRKLGNWREEMTCPEKEVTSVMEVAMPTFQMGFKCAPIGTGPEATRREIVGDLAAEALFGESSALYLKLYEQGLIDSSFGGGFETVDGMAMLTLSGDSDDARAVRDAVLEQAKVLARDGIPAQDFLRLKRSAMGRRIRDLDSFDGVCFRLCAYHFSGFDYFDFPSVYASVTEDEIRAFVDTVVTEERCAVSVVNPND